MDIFELKQGYITCRLTKRVNRKTNKRDEKKKDVKIYHIEMNHVRSSGDKDYKVRFTN